MSKVFKISDRISLPVNENEVENKAFIPKDVPFENNKIPMEQVGIALDKNIPVLLIGETGTGKTSLVRHIANKTNNGFVRVNHNGGTTVEDLVGRWLIDEKGTRWVDGILVEAMKKGYYYLADEINASSADINFIYHSLLDDDNRIILIEKGNEVVIPHGNFRFFGAMNPPTEYAGTKELNKALNSRFLVVKLDFPAPKTEAKIVSKRTGLPMDIAERMVKFAVEIRNMHAKETIRFVLSTRELIMWAEMYKIYDKYIQSAQTTILNKISNDDVQSVTDLLGLHFKKDDMTKKPEEDEVVPIPATSTKAPDVIDLSKIPRIELVTFNNGVDSEGMINRTHYYKKATYLQNPLSHTEAIKVADSELDYSEQIKIIESRIQTKKAIQFAQQYTTGSTTSWPNVVFNNNSGGGAGGGGWTLNQNTPPSGNIIDELIDGNEVPF